MPAKAKRAKCPKGLRKSPSGGCAKPKEKCAKGMRRSNCPPHACVPIKSPKRKGSKSPKKKSKSKSPKKVKKSPKKSPKKGKKKSPCRKGERLSKKTKKCAKIKKRSPKAGAALKAKAKSPKKVKAGAAAKGKARTLTQEVCLNRLHLDRVKEMVAGMGPEFAEKVKGKSKDDMCKALVKHYKAKRKEKKLAPEAMEVIGEMADLFKEAPAALKKVAAKAVAVVSGADSKHAPTPGGPPKAPAKSPAKAPAKAKSPKKPKKAKSPKKASPMAKSAPKERKKRRGELGMLAAGAKADERRR